MSRFQAYILFFFLPLLIGIAFVHIADADPEIDALLDEIAALESERESLAESKAEAETEKAAATESLNSLSDSIVKVERQIDVAYDAYMTAANDEERAHWASVLADLEKYRQTLVGEYNSVAYTIEMLESDIERLNRNIAAVESSLQEAYARLEELLN